MCDKMPKIILLFSGKRKSGKDTFTDLVNERVKDVAVNIKISAPIKLHYSESKGLDFELLMGTGNYKETFRLEMIQWSEQVRKSDHGYFCRAAIKMTNAIEKPVWIVSDIRRRSDLQWFRDNYGNIKTVRIVASEEQRRKRGWIFTNGIDDEETECDLDCIHDWDIVVENSGSVTNLEPAVDNIVRIITQAVQLT